MFCTPDNFSIPPYAIPNLSQYPNTFQTYIDTHEAAILKRLLGVELYNAAIAGHNSLPPVWGVGGYSYTAGALVLFENKIYEAIVDNDLKQPDLNPAYWLFIEDNIWAALGQGAIITIDGKQIEWLGMADMLTPAIFYYWLRDTWDNNSGIGVVQGKAENAEVISPARRLVDAYNSFAMKAETLNVFIVQSNTPDVVYPDYPDYNSCGCSYPVTAYPGTLNTFNL